MRGTDDRELWLARLTAYELSRTRDRDTDSVQLERAIRESAPPPPGAVSES